VQHAGLEPLGREQRQRQRGLIVLEQAHAGADRDRVDEQVKLVKQPGREQLTDD
jgi:hypothetical protein